MYIDRGAMCAYINIRPVSRMGAHIVKNEKSPVTRNAVWPSCVSKLVKNILYIIYYVYVLMCKRFM